MKDKKRPEWSSAFDSVITADQWRSWRVNVPELTQLLEESQDPVRICDLGKAEILSQEALKMLDQQLSSEVSRRGSHYIPMEPELDFVSRAITHLHLYSEKTREARVAQYKATYQDDGQLWQQRIQQAKSFKRKPSKFEAEVDSLVEGMETSEAEITPQVPPLNGAKHKINAEERRKQKEEKRKQQAFEDDANAMPERMERNKIQQVQPISLDADRIFRFYLKKAWENNIVGEDFLQLMKNELNMTQEQLYAFLNISGGSFTGPFFGRHANMKEKMKGDAVEHIGAHFSIPDDDQHMLWRVLRGEPDALFPLELSEHVQEMIQRYDWDSHKTQSLMFYGLEAWSGRSAESIADTLHIVPSNYDQWKRGKYPPSILAHSAPANTEETEFSAGAKEKVTERENPIFHVVGLQIPHDSALANIVAWTAMGVPLDLSQRLGYPNKIAQASHEWWLRKGMEKLEARNGDPETVQAGEMSSIFRDIVKCDMQRKGLTTNTSAYTSQITFGSEDGRRDSISPAAMNGWINKGMPVTQKAHASAIGKSIGYQGDSLEKFMRIARQKLASYDASILRKNSAALANDGERKVRFTRLAQNAGYSILELAEVTGLGKSLVNRIDSGSRYFTAEEINILMPVLQIPEEDRDLFSHWYEGAKTGPRSAWEPVHHSGQAGRGR